MTKKTKIITFLIVFGVFLRFFCVCGFCLSQSVQVKSYATTYSKEVSSAKAFAVIEASTGRLLYSKNENERLPMASTTKIITAIVAIENSANLDEIYEIPSEAVGIEGSSIFLKSGEHLSLRELLYGLMLRSGNDAAVAIAIIVSGSVEKFVQVCNDKCKELGLENTHIVTPNGLHNDEHYTTASDLARITAYALKNETFAEIVSTKEKNISSEFDTKYGFRFLKNKNRLLNMIEGADGVKTGYTKKAGRCFVGSATRGGMQVVCVVLNCVPMFEETANLIEKAFKEYKMVRLFKKGELFEKEIKNGKKTQKIPILIEKDINYPLKTTEIQKIKARVDVDENLCAPIQEDVSVGNLSIYLENNLIFSQKIYTIKVEKEKEENSLKKILKVF